MSCKVSYILEQNPSGDHFACGQCGQKFSDLPKLTAHALAHRTGNPHACSECDDQFSSYHGLRLHSRKHARGEPHVCSECGKRFVQLATLQRHLLTHAKKKAHACSKCGKAFSRLRALNTHMRTHTKERPYSCNDCRRKFRLLSGLKQHKKENLCGCTEERPTKIVIRAHLCSECGKLFSQSNELRKHVRTHTGEKPLVGSECGKGFSQSSSLNQHQLTKLSHTGEKPHVCSECGKRFSRSGALRVHLHMHARKKSQPLQSLEQPQMVQQTSCRPHTSKQKDLTEKYDEMNIAVHGNHSESLLNCCYCGEQFKDSANLTQHHEIHTGLNYSSCFICVLGFSRVEEVENHLSTHVIVPSLLFGTKPIKSDLYVNPI